MLYRIEGRYVDDEPGVWSEGYVYTGDGVTLEKAEALIESEKAFDSLNGMYGAYEYRAVEIDE